MARLAIYFATLALGLTLGRAAEAQSAADSATAESLFNEALTLLSNQQASEACPKLEESQRLDPGVGTLLYLADCYQRIGRSASAWATFREAAYLAKDKGDERETVAIEFAQKLEPELSYLTVKVTPRPGVVLEVEHDGKRMGEALWNTAIPVDPGTHHFKVSAPGKQAWSAAVDISSGPARTEVDVPALEAAAPAPLPAAPPPPSPAPLSRAPSRITQRQWIGWSLIGVGGAGLIGGGVFALLAHGDDKDADSHCRPDILTLCNASGVKLSQAAKSKARFATVSTVVGVAAAGAGVTLLLTAPPRASADHALGLGTRFTGDGAELSFLGDW